MKKFIISIVLCVLVLAGFSYVAAPTSLMMPVSGATMGDYNHDSFWCPWGDHHHHGVDIFAKVGTPITPAKSGIVIFVTYNKGRGGNTVSVMDYSGTIYYYAHMDSIRVSIGDVVNTNSIIGTVGKTGNAINTPAHLHFSVMNIWPKDHSFTKYDDFHCYDDKYKWLFYNPDKLLRQ